LAKASDQFRASDVTIWGIVALVCWGFAVLAANVSGLIPASAFAALHNSRLDSATFNEVRDQVAALEDETARMRRENNVLMQRFDLSEQARADATRRLGALETSIPDLLEAIPEQAAIDTSATASVIEGTAMSFEADGGTVTVEQKPLIALLPGTAYDPPVQTAAVSTDGTFGVALGFPVAESDAEAQWQGMLAKVGTLLIGLWPVMTDSGTGNGKIVVAGPISTQTLAAELCGRLDRVGIPCQPVPFKGAPLPLLN
jgi:hypothetical protein